MSLIEREADLRRMVPSVVGRYLLAHLRLAAWNLDQFARLSILEGAAGISPGTWLRQKSRGFGAALDHFGPRLAASWTANSDQGVYDKALATAARMLRNVTGTDADDLVQELISGSMSSSGPSRNRLFYSVGSALRKYENDLSQGEITPNHRRIKGTIDHWVTRAARDVIRSWKEKRQESFGVGRPEGFDPTRTVGVPELDDDERANLLLLALQSPGGPGRQVRRIIDQQIDRSFPPASRPMVRAFLEKIGQPKYRSPSEMKRLVSKFDPAKWFTQAYNLVRKELMEELGVSAQQLTNVLGGNAKKVFRFMREKVGRDPKVRRVIKELADEIEILEPVVSRIAEDRESQLTERQRPHDSREVVRMWLEKLKERGANLDSGTALASLEEHFEKDDMRDVTHVMGPFAQYSRGPVVLRVADAWLASRSD